MNYLEMLKQRYINYQTRVIQSGNSFEFVILNPHNKSNIVVDNSSGFENELTFYFSYHHMHFGSDFTALTEYIDSFLTNSRVALEFFRNGQRAFGGDILLTGADLKSPVYISQYFGYTSSYLVGLSYKVDSWSGVNDFETGFIENDDLRK